MKQIQETQTRKPHQKHKQPILIDARRIYNPEEFKQKMKFTAIGRGH